MNFHILIVGRLKSKRLPKKVLLPLGSDNTLASFLMRRLYYYFSDHKNVKITFITSDSPDDLPLVNHIASLGFNVFCGHPANVIDRMLGADLGFSSDFLIRVTADNPLTSPFHINKLIKAAQSLPLIDYSISPDLNTGFRAELISKQYLRTLSHNVIDPNSSEYMTFMLDRPSFSNVLYIKPSIGPDLRKYSFTIDTHDQYAFVKSLVEQGCNISDDDLSILSKASLSSTPCFDYDRYSRPSSELITKYNCSWICDLSL